MGVGRGRDDRCVHSFDCGDGFTDVNICKTYQTVNYKCQLYLSEGKEEEKKRGTEEGREGGKEGRERQRKEGRKGSKGGSEEGNEGRRDRKRKEGREGTKIFILQSWLFSHHVY